MGGLVSRRGRSGDAEHKPPVAAHRHSVTCIAVYGEDGELMVTASEDRTVCLWDLSLGGKYKRHWQVKALHGHGLQQSAHMPDRAMEGDASHRRTVASVHEGAMVRCPQPACPREGHGHWVTCLHVDGESSLVYSGSMDKTIKAWDMYTARCLRTYVDGADWVTGIHVRRDVVWSSSEDGCIRLWKAHPHLDANADDVAALVGEIHVGGAAIKRLEAPDADHLVSGDAGGTLCYWHLKLGFTQDVCLQARARTGVGTVSCIVLPYHSRQVETWKVERRPLRLTPTTRALKPIHMQAGTRAQSARVTTLVGGHLGLEMWDLCPLVSSGSSVRSSSLVRRFDGHLAAITCIAVLDGTLWSGSEDGMLRAWALDTGACLQMYVGHIGPVRSLAVISHTHLEHLRAAESGKPAARSTLSAGGLVCSGGGDVRIWDMDSGDVISVVWQRRVDAMALTGAILVAASDGHVWSTRNMPRVLPSRILPSSLLGSAASSVLRPSVEALSDAHKSSPTSTAALQKHTIAAGIDGGQLKKLLGQT